MSRTVQQRLLMAVMLTATVASTYAVAQTWMTTLGSPTVQVVTQ